MGSSYWTCKTNKNTRVRRWGKWKYLPFRAGMKSRDRSLEIAWYVVETHRVAVTIEPGWSWAYTALSCWSHGESRDTEVWEAKGAWLSSFSITKNQTLVLHFPVTARVLGACSKTHSLLYTSSLNMQTAWIPHCGKASLQFPCAFHHTRRFKSDPSSQWPPKLGLQYILQKSTFLSLCSPLLPSPADTVA